MHMENFDNINKSVNAGAEILLLQAKVTALMESQAKILAHLFGTDSNDELKKITDRSIALSKEYFLSQPD